MFQSSDYHQYRRSRKQMLNHMKRFSDPRPEKRLKASRLAVAAGHQARKSLMLVNHDREDLQRLSDFLAECEKEFRKNLLPVVPSHEYNFVVSVMGWASEMGHPPEKMLTESLIVLGGVAEGLDEGHARIREVYCERGSAIPRPVQAVIQQCLDKKADLSDAKVFVRNGIAAIQTWMPDLLLLPRKVATTES